jgi:hypothetical protein
VAWLTKTVLTDEDRWCLRSLVLELGDIRKQLDRIAEALAKLNDKQFLKQFSQEIGADLSEQQIDDYQLALQRKADAAESELRY